METTGNQRQILMLHQERPVRAEHDVVLSAPLMTDAMHHAVLKSGRGAVAFLAECSQLFATLWLFLPSARVLQ